MGLVQNWRFSGNSRVTVRTMSEPWRARYIAPRLIAVSGSTEAGVAKQFQPMTVGLPRQ
jgi:hypothetical protein